MKQVNDLDYAADFIAKLILLCDMKDQDRQKLLRPIRRGVGDYMGSGYAFIDMYNEIYSEFCYNCSDELWKRIRIALDQNASKRKGE